MTNNFISYWSELLVKHPVFQTGSERDGTVTLRAPGLKRLLEVTYERAYKEGEQYGWDKHISLVDNLGKVNGRGDKGPGLDSDIFNQCLAADLVVNNLFSISS